MEIFIDTIKPKTASWLPTLSLLSLTKGKKINKAYVQAHIVTNVNKVNTLERPPVTIYKDIKRTKFHRPQRVDRKCWNQERPDGV